MDIIFILTLASIGVLSSPWFAHVIQTVGSSDEWGWGNFEKFKKHLYKVDKDCIYFEDEWQHSVFGDFYFHAWIIKFEDKGMILSNPLAYWRVKFLMDKYIKDNHTNLKSKKKRVKW